MHPLSIHTFIFFPNHAVRVPHPLSSSGGVPYITKAHRLEFGSWMHGYLEHFISCSQKGNVLYLRWLQFIKSLCCPFFLPEKYLHSPPQGHLFCSRWQSVQISGQLSPWLGLRDRRSFMKSKTNSVSQVNDVCFL